MQLRAAQAPGIGLGTVLCHQARRVVGFGGVAAELRYGAACLGSATFAALLEQWLDLLSIEPWPEDASKIYARIRHELERQGTPIGNMDLLIAAHVLATDAILITNNGREFDRVPGLKLENWT